MKIPHTLSRSLLILFTLGCFALLPVAQAAPPPKGEDRGNGNSAAENVQALNLSTTGPNNTAHGWFSLFSNTSGSSNTADGFRALYSNTSGFQNTADGAFALFSNTEGFFNTAAGDSALLSNTTGIENTANGAFALKSNTTGGQNTATGISALFNNTTGSSNTAIGAEALFFNTEGNFNTAIGVAALESNTTGSNNIALGEGAGVGVTTANNVICIGAGGLNMDNSCYIGEIFGQTSFEGVGVFVNSNGKVGTNLSSRRFKKDIQAMDKASEAILALKPVTFHYKTDSKGVPQFGLIAEEVADVNRDLVVRDKEGKPYSVRYDQVNAMLLNEFLKEQRKVERQQTTIGQLK